MSKVSANDPRPPYVQIADDIRQRVTSGELSPGVRLTANREMATEYGVAPMTVHQAIRILRDEGLLVSSQGRGVFVSSPTSASAEQPAPTTDEVRQQVDALQTRADQLERTLDDKASSSDVSDLQLEVNELRKQLGKLTSQMIDLYAKLGQPYPRDVSASSQPKGRRGTG